MTGTAPPVAASIRTAKYVAGCLSPLAQSEIADTSEPMFSARSLCFRPVVFRYSESVMGSKEPITPVIAPSRFGMTPVEDGRATIPGMAYKSMRDKEIEERIRAYLREYMDDRRIGQTELAERLQVTQSGVSLILGGRRGFGLGLALKISRLLRVSMPRLLEEDPPEKFWARDTYPGRRDK